MASATENVTVLFTDLVGSTQLATSLTPDAADAVRREHFSTLRRAITETGGSEVKNTGDGLMVVFSTASAALACAVAMQQAVYRHNEASGRALGLRIGLSSGEVTPDDGDYFGDSVIEAARLCASALGGQILAAELSRSTAGRRAPYSFRYVGELELKGLPEALATTEVGWEPPALGDSEAERALLPARLALEPEVGVIGRREELDVLHAAFKRVSAGDGREVVLIAGEAGLGKTTIAAEFARGAQKQGASVLLGHCQEETGAPYQPFRETLGHYVTYAPDTILTSHVEFSGPNLGLMVPALSSRLGITPSSTTADLEAERYLLFAAVIDLLVRASEDQVLVVVLDDLQWADKPSLQLLRHVVASIEPVRALIVGTYRNTDLSQSDPLVETLAALHREPGVTRIDLKGLDDEDVVEFLERSKGTELSEAELGLARALYWETDGNPFFVTEVLHHLADTGQLVADNPEVAAAEHTDAWLLPDSVREVVGSRVGRLGDPAKQVLALAAVIGRDFDLEVLASVSNRTEDEVLDILDAAYAAALVREVSDVPGHYAFTHSLIRRTLYDDLGVTRRARAHRAIAEILEDQRRVPSAAAVRDLAYHWFHATQPVDVSKAIEYSQRAAESALEALAPDEALRYYKQALQLHAQLPQPDPLLGVDLHIAWGTAQRQVGAGEYRTTLLAAAAEAERIGATDRVVAAALANSRGFFSAVGGVDHERIGQLERALGALGEEQSATRARLLALLAQELAPAGELQQRLALSKEAVDIARALGDPQVLVEVLNLRFNAILGPEMLPERLEAVREASALAEELNDPVARLFAAMFTVFANLDAGNRGEIDRASEAAISLADQIGQPTLRWITMWTRVLRSWLDGDLDAAEGQTNDALALGFETEQPDASVVPGILLMFLRWAQGRTVEIEPVLTQMLADDVQLPGLKAGLATLHCENGNLDEARAVTAGEVASRFASIENDPYQLNSVVLWCHAVADLRHHEAARALLPRLVSHPHDLGAASVVTSGTVATATGQLQAVLGQPGEAVASFRAGLEFSERLGAPFLVATTHYWWGRCLLDAGDHTLGDPKDHLSAALALAQTYGYQGIERRIARLRASCAS
jgi:class 3 adenylate cyclase/tetratricopeptide (TPR) repeat protein